MTDNDQKKTQRVRIELYASHLKNVAGAFKGTSDPYAVVTLLANNPKEKPQIIGQTEVIKNCLNPQWTTFIDLDYRLGSLTRFNVGIYDEIRKAKHNKPMGSAMFEVGEILGSRGNVKAKKLRNNGGILFCRITAAPVPSSSLSTAEQQYSLLHLQLRGIGLKNVEGLFGKSDPFLEISYRVDAAGGAGAGAGAGAGGSSLFTWQPVYRSKQVMNNLNPIWPEFKLDMARLCQGDYQREIQITVYDWEKSGKHRKIGQVQTNVDALLQAVTPDAGNEINYKQVDTRKALALYTTAAAARGGKSKRDNGKLVVVQAFVEAGSCNEHNHHNNNSDSDKMADVSPLPLPIPLPVPVPPPPVQNKPTFIDYLSGGCELELSIAIDFTGSNGDPRRPGTLHYIHPNDGDGQLNDYEKAFTAVGSIVARYDSNQRFPVYGFGAKFGGVIQHCFQVGNKEEMNGLGEALQAYRQVFQSGLTMSGPTVFAEVIAVAAARARSAQEKAEREGRQTYGILLILTDGAVTNIERTKQALRDASDAPLSIVIVGVGSGGGDFYKMQFLDDMANADPNQQQRDIVQFVEFNKYAHDKSALTQKTLDEIPAQLVNYFYTTRGIMPLPPIHGSQITLDAAEPDEQDIDLSLDYTSEEEIVLGDIDNLPKFDDTKYDSAGVYLCPPVPVTPHVSSYGVPASYDPSYDSSLSSSSPPPPPSAPPSEPPDVSRPFGQALSNQPVPQHPSVFHVLVPPGVHPGDALQVQNPKTHQYMIVFVPQGVYPGGKFAVAYE